MIRIQVSRIERLAKSVHRARSAFARGSVAVKLFDAMEPLRKLVAEYGCTVSVKAGEVVVVRRGKRVPLRAWLKERRCADREASNDFFDVLAELSHMENR